MTGLGLLATQEPELLGGEVGYQATQRDPSWATHAAGISLTAARAALSVPQQ